MVWTRAAPWAPPGRPARNTASRHRRPAVRSGIATAATGVARRLTCWGCRNGGCFSGWDVNVPSKRAFPRSRRGPPGPLRQQVSVQAGTARGPPAAAGADAAGYRQRPPGPRRRPGRRRGPARGAPTDRRLADALVLEMVSAPPRETPTAVAGAFAGTVVSRPVSCAGRPGPAQLAGAVDERV